jgi:hypothetical protein
MVKQEFVERLEALEKRVDELTAKLGTAKIEHSDEPMFIPGAEYDFVPTVIDRCIVRGVVTFVEVLPAPEKNENQ